PVDGTALAASAAAGLLFGLLRALLRSQHGLAGCIREGVRGLAGHSHGRRFRSVLIAGEMALAVILFTGACLLIRSLERVQQVSVGFDPRDVALAEVQLPFARYASDAKMRELYDGVLERLRHTSGIKSAAAISNFFLV